MVNAGSNLRNKSLEEWSKGKGKAFPLQAWTGPECSRKLRFPDFVTTALEGGKVVSLTHLPTLPLVNTPETHFCLGTAVAQWLRCCATHRKVTGSIPANVSGFFFDIKSFRSHYGPGVDSASNRNENREYFLGFKDGRCVRLTTLPPSCAVVTKSGSLNFLEPSGPFQAYNGTALPLPFTHFC